MARIVLFLTLVALALQIPTRSYASSYERSNTDSTLSRRPNVPLYRLVYIVDDRGHWILIRSDGTRETRGPQKPSRTRK
jgi:hypothetical protein